MTVWPMSAAGHDGGGEPGSGSRVMVLTMSLVLVRPLAVARPCKADEAMLVEALGGYEVGVVVRVSRARSCFRPGYGCWSRLPCCFPLRAPACSCNLLPALPLPKRTWGISLDWVGRRSSDQAEVEPRTRSSTRQGRDSSDDQFATLAPRVHRERGEQMRLKSTERATRRATRGRGLLEICKRANPGASRLPARPSRPDAGTCPRRRRRRRLRRGVGYPFVCPLRRPARPASPCPLQSIDIRELLALSSV